MSSMMMSIVIRRSLRLSPRITTRTTASRQHHQCCSCSTSTSTSCGCACHLLSSKASSSSSSVLLSHHRFFASSSSSSSAVAKKLTSDQKLSRVIESEIQCAQEEENDGLIQGNNLPDGFPFDIIDNPGEETITLKRQFKGENIQVLVYMPQIDGEDDDNNDDDGQVNISMNVTIVKGDGPRLEFTCVASPDDIAIDSMLIKGPDTDSSNQIPYEGPEFSDLDENLQNELHVYLERRGIKPSLTNFLQEYMVNKDNKEYLNWLKNMKEFVEK